MNTSIRLDKVVIQHMQIVVQNVDRRGAAIRIFGRCPVGGDADTVVKVRNRIVSNHMTGSVHLDRIITGQKMRSIRAGTGPQWSRPANQTKPIVTTQEQVVRDVEITRAGLNSLQTPNPIFSNRQFLTVVSPTAPNTSFCPAKNATSVFLNRQTIKDMMLRRHDIEQSMIAVAIKNNFTIASRFDCDRLFRGAFECQRHRAVERSHLRIDIIPAFGLIQSDMDQNRVTRLSPSFPDNAPARTQPERRNRLAARLVKFGLLAASPS